MQQSRRWPWIVFAVCALLVLEGLGYVTWRVLTLERAEREARSAAGFQQALRLALWRADAAATPIIASEASRPYFEYRAFYPAARPYEQMALPLEPGEPAIASPLLDGAPGPIRLHFQVRDGVLESPQAPRGMLAALAESQGRDRDALARAGALKLQLELIRETSTPLSIADDAPADGTRADSTGDRLARMARGGDRQQADEAQTEQGALEAVATAEAEEFDARQLAFERAVGSAPTRSAIPPPAPGDALLAAPIEQAEGVSVGAFTPAWLRDPASGRLELFYTREVVIGGEAFTQGFWVDWPQLRQLVLEDVAGLVQQAELEPVASDAAAGGSRLASVPARLVAAPPAIVRAGWSPAAWSPTRWTLAMTWAAVLLAIAAIAVVLRKAIELGERRGRFVSAVTHELRTPMTTFRLYTQMLAGGMVTDEARRAQYLATLDREASRLSRLVEHVLEYARLGRARSGSAEPVAIADLLAGCTPSLEQAAGAGGFTIEWHDRSGDAHAPISPDSFERILGNLVDNAVRYAREADDKRIVISVERDGQSIRIGVRDFGPGVPPGERKRIFKPFTRARADEHGPGGGLGLGLALSRGLARSAGGSLELAEVQGPGASFVLTLPAAFTRPLV